MRWGKWNERAQVRAEEERGNTYGGNEREGLKRHLKGNGMRIGKGIHMREKEGGLKRHLKGNGMCIRETECI